MRRPSGRVLCVSGGDETVAGAAAAAWTAAVRWLFSRAARSTTSPRTLAVRTWANHRAIREGSVFCVDLMCFNDTRMIINTSSIGAYPTFVRARERLEHKIGKPAAAAYAMLRTLRNEESVRIRYDNKTLQTSLFFLGNSTYLPSGFAPAQRNRIDDGLIDVRILETGRPFSKIRVMTAMMAGRLGTQPPVSRASCSGVQLQLRRRADRHCV